MDRLEKALQKAREQREQAIAGGEAATAAPPPVAAPSQPAPPPAPAPAARGAPGGQRVLFEDDLLDSNRIVAQRKRDADADMFRMLRTKVLQMMGRDKLRTLAITSPNYGDGKTTVATNLAMSLALDVKQTVLLVDLDLRKPDLCRFLGITPDVGLSDYLLHDAPVMDCMVKPGIERLVLLPTANVVDNSSEILGTPKMVTLATELKTRYADRIVIYDMPPLLTQDDTIAFLPNVDGVLLVVRDGVTKRDDLDYCLHLLENTNLLGTVLNSSPERIARKA